MAEAEKNERSKKHRQIYIHDFIDEDLARRQIFKNSNTFSS
mgnify:CR=1 FL=1